jgi:hypothetical protein
MGQILILILLMGCHKVGWPTLTKPLMEKTGEYYVDSRIQGWEAETSRLLLCAKKYLTVMTVVY